MGVVVKTKDKQFTESSVEEALEVEPGALMIWSVIVRWSEGGGRERSCGAEFINRPPLPPTQFFLIRLNAQQPCGRPDTAALMLMLCCHEILVVEEAK